MSIPTRRSFDLDGTPSDTLDDLSEQHQPRPGPPRPAESGSREGIRQFVGNGVGRLASIWRSGGHQARNWRPNVWREFRPTTSPNGAQDRPYPGIPELLDALRACESPARWWSTVRRGGNRALCRRYFGDTNPVAIWESQGWRASPPRYRPPALAELGAGTAGRVLGDSDVDIQTARNSGLTASR